jgi:outer membrane protein assembly factor BamB
MSGGRDRTRYGRWRRAAVGVACALLPSCVTIPQGVLGYEGFLDAPRSARPQGRMIVRWERSLMPEVEGIDGRFLPIERAAAALDPEHNRIYLGSSRGYFWAFTGQGGRVYMYRAGGAIGSQPLLDAERDEIYFASDDGVVHALVASTGQVRWRAEIDGAVGRRPIATDDVLFIATDADVVVAIARDTGEALWRYRRDPPEGFYIAEHAGLLLQGRRLITGFTDGAVVSLDSIDGHVQWTRETLADLPVASATDVMRFTDVDTTPLLVDGTLYAASFAGGLYALDLNSGSVRWIRSDLTGVTGLAVAPDGMLIASSGDRGVLGVARANGDLRWRTPVLRGAPTAPRVIGDLVLYGETEGGLVALSTASGTEVGRIEDGHGFAAPVDVAEGLGAAISNTGHLYVFSVN